VKILTSRVDPDEAAYGLYEGPRQVPGKGRRWLQAVYVVRGDTIAEWTHDFGPVENFERIQGLLMPSQGENTVAQLQEHADKNREDQYWANRADEMLSESTLIEDHIRQIDQNRGIIQNKSTFGRSGHFERNGYPRAAAKELYRGR
jgi:hypothetical protein